MEKTLYRYTRDTYEMFDDEGHFDEEGTPQVDLVKYPVIRETKCFYFIQVRRTIGLWSEKKVSKNAKNTFAYDTKEKALENLRKGGRKMLDLLFSVL